MEYRRGRIQIMLPPVPQECRDGSAGVRRQDRGDAPDGEGDPSGRVLAVGSFARRLPCSRTLGQRPSPHPRTVERALKKGSQRPTLKKPPTLAQERAPQFIDYTRSLRDSRLRSTDTQDIIRRLLHYEPLVAYSISDPNKKPTGLSEQVGFLGRSARLELFSKTSMRLSSVRVNFNSKGDPNDYEHGTVAGRSSKFSGSSQQIRFRPRPKRSRG